MIVDAVFVTLLIVGVSVVVAGTALLLWLGNREPWAGAEADPAVETFGQGKAGTGSAISARTSSSLRT